jgi:hypothetical protein
MIDYVNKDKENVIITFDEFINIEKRIQDMQGLTKSQGMCIFIAHSWNTEAVCLLSRKS